MLLGYAHVSLIQQFNSLKSQAVLSFEALRPYNIILDQKRFYLNLINKKIFCLVYLKLFKYFDIVSKLFTHLLVSKYSVGVGNCKSTVFCLSPMMEDRNAKGG